MLQHIFFIRLRIRMSRCWISIAVTSYLLNLPSLVFIPRVAIVSCRAKPLIYEHHRSILPSLPTHQQRPQLKSSHIQQPIPSKCATLYQLWTRQPLKTTAEQSASETASLEAMTNFQAHSATSPSSMQTGQPAAGVFAGLRTTWMTQSYRSTGIPTRRPPFLGTRRLISVTTPEILSRKPSTLPIRRMSWCSLAMVRQAPSPNWQSCFGWTSHENLARTIATYQLSSPQATSTIQTSLDGKLSHFYS